MDTILDNLADEEWVYWCIDDKYLIKINLAEMQKTYQWIQTITDSRNSSRKMHVSFG